MISIRFSKILFVCDGNTCRSPMAEAIARGLLGTTADVQSAGIDADSESLANKKAIAVMKERGIDIRGHRSRDIETIDLSAFDLIIAMTPIIARYLRSLGISGSKIIKLNIEDPYNEGIEAYRFAAEALEVELRRLFGIVPPRQATE
ncbi:MAG: hypothetical protein WCF59_02070 [Desulfobaccales bacterium]